MRVRLSLECMNSFFSHHHYLAMLPLVSFSFSFLFLVCVLRVGFLFFLNNHEKKRDREGGLFVFYVNRMEELACF